MTRSRLAAVAALSIPALLIAAPAAPGGEAPTDGFQVDIVGCVTDQDSDQDFVDVKSKVRRKRMTYGGRAAALVPVKGAKVVTKLKDLVQDDGDNVVDAKDADKTNKKGVAKTQHEFNNFGNYKVIAVAKLGGVVIARDTRKFGVGDRESGACDPTIEI
jgi:hypothetical protein